jgi:hypothetical protein
VSLYCVQVVCSLNICYSSVQTIWLFQTRIFKFLTLFNSFFCCYGEPLILVAEKQIKNIESLPRNLTIKSFGRFSTSSKIAK